MIAATGDHAILYTEVADMPDRVSLRILRRGGAKIRPDPEAARTAPYRRQLTGKEPAQDRESAAFQHV